MDAALKYEFSQIFFNLQKFSMNYFTILMFLKLYVFEIILVIFFITLYLYMYMYYDIQELHSSVVRASAA